MEKKKSEKTPNARKKGDHNRPKSANVHQPSATHFSVPDAGSTNGPVGDTQEATTDNNDVEIKTLPPSSQENQRLKKMLQDGNKFWKRLRESEYNLAFFLNKYFRTTLFPGIIPAIVDAIILALLGLNAFTTFVLFSFINEHFTILMVVTPLALLYLIRIMRIKEKPEQQGGNGNQINLGKKLRKSLLQSFNVISYLCSLFLIIILLVIHFQPSLCPAFLCSKPQQTLKTHSQSNNDNNLEISLAETYSTSYVIPGNPKQYTSSNLPMSIPALQIDGQSPQSTYHLIIGLQSLQNGGYGIVIETVDIIINQVLPLPQHPLQVWYPTLLSHTHSDNQFNAFYSGEEPGSVIAAHYVSYNQGGGVQLHPGENGHLGEYDTIDLHVISKVEVNVKFSVRISYRIADEPSYYALTLLQTFDIMFAKKLDWQIYRLQENGHFVVSP